MKQILRNKMLAKLALTLCLAMFTTATWADSSQYFVTDVMLIGANGDANKDYYRSVYKNAGWTIIEYDLNAGCGSKSDYIYLLYKTKQDVDGTNQGYISRFLIRLGKDYPAQITTGGFTYQIVPYAGTDHFVGLWGDLNSNASGDYIHLYYSKDVPSDGQYVTNMWFDADPQSSVGTGSMWDNPGIDLNKGCGKNTPYIYMHVNVAKPIVPPHYPTYYNLAEVTKDLLLQEGDLVTGKLSSTAKITIADGASVKFKDVEIQHTVSGVTKWAGVTCEGDATITIDGTNLIMGLDPDYPAIYVPRLRTLNIKTSGKGRKLKTYSGGFFSSSKKSAAIGGGNGINSGNVIIHGGQIEAHSGTGAYAIGEGANSVGGYIVLRWTYNDDYIYFDGAMNPNVVNFDSNYKFYIEGTATAATPKNISYETIVPYATDGIADLIAEPTKHAVYNLSGQRVTNPKRGLYIVDGKKMVLK